MKSQRTNTQNRKAGGVHPDKNLQL